MYHISKEYRKVVPTKHQLGSHSGPGVAKVATRALPAAALHPLGLSGWHRTGQKIKEYRKDTDGVCEDFIFVDNLTCTWMTFSLFSIYI